MRGGGPSSTRQGCRQAIAGRKNPGSVRRIALITQAGTLSGRQHGPPEVATRFRKGIGQAVDDKGKPDVKSRGKKWDVRLHEGGGIRCARFKDEIRMGKDEKKSECRLCVGRSRTGVAMSSCELSWMRSAANFQSRLCQPLRRER